MLKEGAYTEEESQESIEREPTFSKEVLKRFLESRTTVTDSGRSGMLFRIDPSELDPDDQKKMAFENADNPEWALSIKALKVFNLTKAREEFEALREARSIILKRSGSSSAPIFHVPRAIRFDEIEVNKKTEDFLNNNGGGIIGGKVGIITMDWIEGKNLAVALYEELLRLSPETEDMDPEKFRDVQDFRKLLRALEKAGFVLPEEILTQLKNGVDALHKNHLYHNDLHLGNVILRDGSFENPQLYAIDYADATHERKPIEDNDGEFYLSDENIINSLEPLTKTPETKEREREENSGKEWNDRIAILKQQPVAQKQYESLKDAVNADNQKMLAGQLIAASGSDREVENYLGNLLRLSRENDAYRDSIREFLKEQVGDKKSKMRSFVLNRIQALQRVIEI
jgi:serine/threonine protein kinase